MFAEIIIALIISFVVGFVWGTGFMSMICIAGKPVPSVDIKHNKSIELIENNK